MPLQNPHPLFPTRPQGHGFMTEREAIRAAREVIGGKAKKSLAFITLFENKQWAWLGVSSHEYVQAYCIHVGQSALADESKAGG